MMMVLVVVRQSRWILAAAILAANDTLTFGFLSTETRAACLCHVQRKHFQFNLWPSNRSSREQPSDPNPSQVTAMATGNVYFGSAETAGSHVRVPPSPTCSLPTRPLSTKHYIKACLTPDIREFPPSRGLKELSDMQSSYNYVKSKFSSSLKH